MFLDTETENSVRRSSVGHIHDAVIRQLAVAMEGGNRQWLKLMHAAACNAWLFWWLEHSNAVKGWSD